MLFEISEVEITKVDCICNWRLILSGLSRKFSFFLHKKGVVGCGKGDGYLTSRGRPTDIGLQLG